ncbi:hypothetical protein [Paenibacillus sp. P32E]|uniref:hypothetical protein n=1 Tax=Paenibacillus sp. P32E TaxID=1349434 RepID=UPI00093D0D92|nr:hypothetical protein [Paenibacillus sp. P32E]OKP82529.1 hypothetical protein A3848_28300 [Paenibacillus sp. P32E]
MRRMMTVACVIAGISGWFAVNSQANAYHDKITAIKMRNPFSAWQGVGADEKRIYITSDRDRDFALSNTISVYGVAGKYITEKKNAYTGKDGKKRFMSFGDCLVSNKFLYATVYNFNASPPEEERISRIVKYRLSDLKQIEQYNIGQGTAESIAKYKGSFWVVYHDRNEIKRFDRDFHQQAVYPLSGQFGGEGGYQGIFFIKDNLYANLHGSNEYGKEYAQGMDHYRFDGHEFKFVNRIKPPTYGAGQGVERVGDSIFWADRPGNQIILTQGIDLLRTENDS